MKRSDSERLRKIVSTWESLRQQLQDRQITKEQLMTDEFAQWAVTTPVYNIGEQVYQLSDTIKDQYPDMPWSKVAGLRHRLVHDYEGINWSIIVSVIYEEMDPFVAQVRTILDTMQQ